jgi:hypothetical protein
MLEMKKNKLKINTVGQSPNGGGDPIASADAGNEITNSK